MIKKILSKLFSQKITEKDIECAIDEQTIDCKHFDDDQDKAYVGVPAPIDHVLDEWFAGPYGEPLSESEVKFSGNYKGPLYAPYTAVDAGKNQSIGDDGMHQKMYEMSTRSGKTTVQLDPIGGSENFQGGSENIQQ